MIDINNLIIWLPSGKEHKLLKEARTGRGYISNGDFELNHTNSLYKQFLHHACGFEINNRELEQARASPSSRAQWRSWQPLIISMTRNGWVLNTTRGIPRSMSKLISLKTRDGVEREFRVKMWIRRNSKRLVFNRAPLLDWGLGDDVPDWDDALWGDVSEQLTAAGYEPKRDSWQQDRNNNPFAIYFADCTNLDGDKVLYCGVISGSDNLPSRIRSVMFRSRHIWSGDATNKLGMINCTDDEFVDEDPIVRKMLSAMSNGNHNLLLYGPPGTGKTYWCQEFIKRLKESASDDGGEWGHHLWLQEEGENPVDHFVGSDFSFLNGEVKTWWLTFHQGVSYEDFVLGLRPKMDDGDLSLQPRAGPLLEAMIHAGNPTNGVLNTSIIFVDEINRGDLSRIFGDFITFMDVDKRGIDEEGACIESPSTLKLVFSSLDRDSDAEDAPSEPINVRGVPMDGIPLVDGGYVVPPNLYVIATMNSLDRSVAPMDSAMKRRFHQLSLPPDSDLVEDTVPEEEGYLCKLLMDDLNQWLENQFNEDIQIGHSYFLKINSLQSMVDVWENRILPLLLDLCRSKMRRDNLLNILQFSPESELESSFELHDLNTITTNDWPYEEEKASVGKLGEKNFNDEQLQFFFGMISENANRVVSNG